MEILFLSEPSYPLHPGGAGKCTHLLAAGLVARGHTVRLVCESHRGSHCEEIDGVEVHRVPLPMADEASRAALLCRYLEENLPLDCLDLVHDSGSFLSYFFPLALALKRSRNVPVVTHFRYLVLKHQMAGIPAGAWDALSPDALALEASRNETTQCFAARIADLILSPSAGDALFIDSLYRPEPGRLEILPDPVVIPGDPDRLRSAMRSRWARPGEQLVLFGGRIDDEAKGADIALRAFKRVISQRPNVRLLLTARNEKDLKVFHDELGRSAASIGWIEDNAELAHVFAMADLVLMPSRHESFGMMCAEAMAAGVPVAASPVGALKDMVSHGSTGLLLDSARPEGWEEELANHALMLLSDADRARDMGRAARRFVQENFSVEIVCERLDALYRQVLERNDPSRRPNPQAASAAAFPRIDEADRQRYLAALGRRLGPEAAMAGERTWAGWRSSFESRCTACTRQGIARSTSALIRLGGPFHRAIARVTGHRSVRAAIEEACPLALLQRGTMRTNSFVQADSEAEGGARAVP